MAKIEIIVGNPNSDVKNKFIPVMTLEDVKKLFPDSKINEPRVQNLLNCNNIFNIQVFLEQLKKDGIIISDIKENFGFISNFEADIANIDEFKKRMQTIRNRVTQANILFDDNRKEKIFV